MDDRGCSATSSEEAELREQLITDHYSRRIAELTSQLQLADSKALHFYAEVPRLLLFALGFLSQRHLYNCTKITEMPHQCPYFRASNNVSCHLKLWCVLFANSFTSRTGKVKSK